MDSGQSLRRCCWWWRW